MDLATLERRVLAVLDITEGRCAFASVLNSLRNEHKLELTVQGFERLGKLVCGLHAASYACAACTAGDDGIDGETNWTFRVALSFVFADGSRTQSKPKFLLAKGMWHLRNLAFSLTIWWNSA